MCLQRHSFFFLVASSWAISAGAVTVDSTTTEDLLSRSTIAAYVEIRSGEIAEVGGKSCGALYKAKVITTIKGQIADGDTIEFGPYEGHEIGGRYMIFLSSRDQKVSSITSSGSGLLNAKMDFEKRCAGVLPRNYETLEGSGTIAVLKTFKNDYKPAALFPEAFVTPPQHVQAKIAAPDEVKPFSYSKTSWVPIDALIDVLKKPKSDEAPRNTEQ